MVCSSWVSPRPWSCHITDELRQRSMTMVRTMVWTMVWTAVRGTVLLSTKSAVVVVTQVTKAPLGWHEWDSMKMTLDVQKYLIITLVSQRHRLWWSFSGWHHRCFVQFSLFTCDVMIMFITNNITIILAVFLKESCFLFCIIVRSGLVSRFHMNMMSHFWDKTSWSHSPLCC